MEPQELIDLNKETYDKIAKPFASTRKFLWDDLKPLSQYIKDGDKVLDLGCGTGRLYQLFGENQVEYVGMDNSMGQLEMAREQFPEGNFRFGELTITSLDDEEFDIIYCIAAFHHLPNKELRLKSLREMSRVLKPGGYVVMTNWNLFSDSAQKNVAKGKWKQKIGTGDFIVPWLNSEGELLGKRYYYGYESDELKDLFKEGGFVLEDQYYGKKGERGQKQDSANIISVIKKVPR